MRHLRSDYQSIQPWPTKRPHIAKADPNAPTQDMSNFSGEQFAPIIPDDEPVFVLRAKDKTAPAVLKYWAQLQRDQSGDLITADAVDGFADEMERYAWLNYDGGKLADTPAELLAP